MKRLAIAGLGVVLFASCGKEEESASNEAPTEPAAKTEPSAKVDPNTKVDPAKKVEPAKTDAEKDKEVAKVDPAADVKPPFDFKIAAAPMPYKPNDFVWATYPVNDTGGFGYNMVRFQEAMGDWAKVSALKTGVTHSAFLHAPKTPDAKSLKKGTPVRAHVGVGVKYGRVQSVSGDKVKVKFYVSGPKSGERELPLSSVELWTEAKLEPGTPVLYGEDDAKKLATLALVSNGKAYIIGPKGIVELPESDVTAVDPSPILKKGAKVWAYTKKGMGSYGMYKGKITKVHDKGVWYEWKSTEDKRTAKVSFAKVVKM